VSYISEGVYEVSYAYCSQYPYSTPGNHYGTDYFAQLRWQESPGGPVRTAEIEDEKQCSSRYCWIRYRFSGPPGSRLVASHQSCKRGGFLERSDCHGFETDEGMIPLEKPFPVRIPTFSRVEPATYMPKGYRIGDAKRKEKRARVDGPRLRVLLHMSGSLDPVPSPKFTNWGYATTFRVYWRANTVGSGQNWLDRVRKEGEWTEEKNLERAGNTVAFYLPESALEDTYCAESSCDPVEIKIEAFQDYSSVGRLSPSRSAALAWTKSAEIKVVTVYAKRDDPIQSAWRHEPPTIISGCDAAKPDRIGTVEFAARQDKPVFSVQAVRVELQFRASEGLWGASNLLQELPYVRDSKPPEYRATLPVARLANTGHAWRWRVKAAEGDRVSDWCRFEVAEPPGGQMRIDRGRNEGSGNAVVAKAAPVSSQTDQSPRAVTHAPAPPAAPGQQVMMRPPTAVAQPQPASPPRIAIARAVGNLEVGTNRYGGDYASRDLATAQQCQAACASEAQCKAWTWVKPGIQGPGAKCWLKNQVPAVSKNDCCVSGVK
jgi:hypothetical protein